MILALDIGNSQIHGGLFVNEELKLQFRKTTKQGNTSDELGLFLRTVIRENGFDPEAIREITLCSVVPEIVHSVKNACKKYFDLQPFVLQAGVRTGLKIRYRNPLEVGSDRIANAIAATHLFPGKNLIIVDFGTATTYCAIDASKEYLGGLILPGLRISMEALESKTAKLPSVEILAPEQIVGRSTVESIQSGLYFGNLHALKGIVAQIKSSHFGDESCVVIGTGGFARLFERERAFDALIPELVLAGLKLALEMNLQQKGNGHETHIA